MERLLHEPTVFLVDDDDAVRQSLTLLMNTYGLQVTSCSSAEEFLIRWDPEAVGCIVLDIRMTGMSGLGLQALLAERKITTPILFITGHGDINAYRRAFRGGAVDFMTKPIDEQSLMDGIRKGISLDIRQRQSASEMLHLRERFSQLSERERQVLDLILDGLPNKLIAREIGLSTRTVESHRSRIYQKLGASSLAQLVRSVIRLEDTAHHREAVHPAS